MAKIQLSGSDCKTGLTILGATATSIIKLIVLTRSVPIVNKISARHLPDIDKSVEVNVITTLLFIISASFQLPPPFGLRTR